MPKDNAYLWQHPDEYERITSDNMDNEACVRMCEFVLEGLYEDVEKLVKKINTYPNSKETRLEVKSMGYYLQSDFINGLTFGHGDSVFWSFAKRVPEGSVEIYDWNQTKNGKVSRRKRPGPKKNVENRSRKPAAARNG